MTAQPPVDLRPDREEVIDEVSAPGVIQEKRVIRDDARERFNTLSRVVQGIWWLFGMIEALIAIRFVLKLIGANPDAVFTQIVYSFTELFLWPFAGITPTPAVGAFQFEFSSILGMIVYGLAAWAITRLVWLVFYRPATRSETTIHRQRY